MKKNDKIEGVDEIYMGSDYRQLQTNFYWNYLCKIFSFPRLTQSVKIKAGIEEYVEISYTYLDKNGETQSYTFWLKDPDDDGKNRKTEIAFVEEIKKLLDIDFEGCQNFEINLNCENHAMITKTSVLQFKDAKIRRINDWVAIDASGKQLPRENERDTDN